MDCSVLVVGIGGLLEDLPIFRWLTHKKHCDYPQQSLKFPEVKKLKCLQVSLTYLAKPSFLFVFFSGFLRNDTDHYEPGECGEDRYNIGKLGELLQLSSTTTKTSIFHSFPQFSSSFFFLNPRTWPANFPFSQVPCRRCVRACPTCWTATRRWPRPRVLGKGPMVGLFLWESRKNLWENLCEIYISTWEIYGKSIFLQLWMLWP